MYQVFIDDNLFCDSELDELAIINPVVNLEINKAGSFEFTVAPTHPMAGTIHRRKSVTSVIRDGELLFKGVCVSSSTDFYKQEKVKFEGELTYLNDSILRQHKYTNQTVLSLLTNYINEHNSQVESDRQFEVGTVTVSATDSILRYTNMQPTMKEIQEDLIDNYGGYISIRNEDNHRYIDYVNDNNIANQTIELGKNLIDYQSNIDTLKVATRVIPLGKKLDAQVVEGLDARLDIKSVNDGKDYVQSDDAIANFGIITAVVTFDDVTDANNLKTKGEKYVSEVQFEDVVIECTAFDMGYVTDRVDKFKLADKVRIISSAHGMDKEFVLSKMKINLADPGKDKFTFGKTEKNSLSARVIKENTEIINQVSEAESTMLSKALAQAQSVIAGTKGGYVKVDIDADTQQPYRLLVMDHDTFDRSTNIIQVNKNGIGFSNNGGKSFTSAWNINGVFDASCIKTGELSADVIRANVIKAINDNDSLSIDSAKLNLGICSIESHGIRWTVGRNSGSVSFGDNNQFNVNSGTGTLSLYGQNGVNMSAYSIINIGVTNEPYQAYGIHLNSSVKVTGNLSVTGTKNRIVDTENYGQRAMNAFETCGAYFADIGNVEIAEDNRVIVEINPMFAETVTLEKGYQVQVTPTSHITDFCVIKNKDNFEIIAKNGATFDYMIMAKQKGYEDIYMDEHIEREVQDE